MNTRRRPIFSPKHQRVLEALRSQIAEGRYPPGSRLPAETELPGMLHAGKQTVVRALNELVREGAIVRRRGDGTYVAEHQRPPLLPGRHLRLGLLWRQSVMTERLHGTFQGAMTRGALAAWGLDGVTPEFARAGERETTRGAWTSVTRGATVTALGESVYSRERHPALEAVKAERFDGILTLSIIEEPWIEELLALGIPVVLVDFPSERFAARAELVYVDALPGYRAAVRALAANGARRIHFVGTKMMAAAPSAEMTPEEVQAYQEGRARIDPDSFLRLSAFRAGMDEAGLAVRDAEVHFEHHGAEAALANRLLALPEAERPEAFVCHSATQAEALIKACAEKGVRVRGAGAAEGAQAGAAQPIVIDGVELGRTAAEMLLWKLQRPQRAPLRVGVPMEWARAAQPVAAG
ncbi:MAG: GntR family transcriptional regulator [Planctomycetes bacterium]|nr:GntR family transcriptional regulator [Planctomycetota bacterium]